MAVPVIKPPEGTFGVPQIDVDKIKRKYLDVPYASQSPNQLLDIFLPPEGAVSNACLYPRRRVLHGRQAGCAAALSI